MLKILKKILIVMSLSSVMLVIITGCSFNKDEEVIQAYRRASAEVDLTKSFDRDLKINMLLKIRKRK